jgi:rhamnose transport system permease protein
VGQAIRSAAGNPSFPFSVTVVTTGSAEDAMHRVDVGDFNAALIAMPGASAALAAALADPAAPYNSSAAAAFVFDEGRGGPSMATLLRFNVPPLIATLATLALYRGLAEGISEARSVRGYPEWFFFFGQGEVLGVPFQLWVLGFATLVAAVILGLTPFGRATYAIGANEVAARFSGIRVNATKLWIYTAAGFCSALAAVIFVSRVTTTRSDMGTGLELDAITAVVLGGTSIFGGRGTIIGTALGLILIQALKNGLALSGVKGDGTIVVIGLVLIGAILVGALFDKNRGG